MPLEYRPGANRLRGMKSVAELGKLKQELPLPENQSVNV